MRNEWVSAYFFMPNWLQFTIFIGWRSELLYWIGRRKRILLHYLWFNFIIRTIIRFISLLFLAILYLKQLLLRREGNVIKETILYRGKSRYLLFLPSFFFNHPELLVLNNILETFKFRLLFLHIFKGLGYWLMFPKIEIIRGLWYYFLLSIHFGKCDCVLRFGLFDFLNSKNRVRYW